ncbi:hypothetical protein ONZ45_g11177 [Pleurotus djamor]|nr:hypothetical protein ONZ45_g11177 [Pleurotus djamor]
MITLLFVGLSVVSFVALVWRPYRNRYPRPPGPRGYPIIGSLLEAPAENQWVKYEEWAKEFNTDILYFEVLGQPIMILSSLESANELLNHRSALTSSRPHSVMLRKLMGWSGNFVFQPYGDAWRARRKLFWQNFKEHPSNLSLFRPIQTKHARRFVRRLLDSPKDFIEHTRFTPAAAIFEATFGISITSESNPHIERARKAIQHFDNALGAGFLKYAEVAHRDLRDMIDTPYIEVTERLHRDEAGGSSTFSSPSCVLERILANVDGEMSASQEDLIKDATVVAFSAGADTTQAPLLNIFAAMTHFPEVQRKAQREIDNLLDSRKHETQENGSKVPLLPTFDDLPSLPYSQAIVWELIRWQPFTPLGFFHLSTSEDTYRGFHIPKGTIIMANIWAMMRNPEYFPDPERFMPERFFSEDSQLNDKLVDIVRVSFGYGRRLDFDFRICPGRVFAWDTIWIVLVSTLRAFDISPIKDEFGRDVLPDLELEPILVTYASSQTYTSI